MSCAFNGPAPTNGAYEPFGLTSAEIGLVGANKIVANFNAIDQPILPARTTCAAFSNTFSARFGGSSQALTDCDRSGDNQITLTTTSSASGATVADISYDGAGCVVTDSRRIGLDPGQCLFPISQQAVTNNVGGGAPSLSMTKTGITFVDHQPGEQWIVCDANWTICPGCGLQVWLQLRAADVVPPPQSYRPQ
jgi:hypothetical protein